MLPHSSPEFLFRSISMIAPPQTGFSLRTSFRANIVIKVDYSTLQTAWNQIHALYFNIVISGSIEIILERLHF